MQTQLHRMRDRIRYDWSPRAQAKLVWTFTALTVLVGIVLIRTLHGTALAFFVGCGVTLAVSQGVREWWHNRRR